MTDPASWLAHEARQDEPILHAACCCLGGYRPALGAFAHDYEPHMRRQPRHRTDESRQILDLAQTRNRSDHDVTRSALETGNRDARSGGISGDVNAVWD